MNIASRNGAARIILAACALTVVSCADADQPQTYSSMEAVDLFPSERLEDWVSYADQISIVTVVSETMIKPPREVPERGEGYLGRSVTLKIESTIWVQTDVKAIEGTLDMLVAGWILREGNDKTMAIIDGGPRIEVGDRLLIPFARDLDGSLGLLSSNAVVVLDQNKATLIGGQHNAAVSSLVGLEPAAVGKLLAATKPDPRALKYWHLSPYQRAQAVLNEAATDG